MPDKPADPSAESGGSISWKLIQESLARREFVPNDMVEVEKVSGTPDGKVEVSGKDAQGAPVHHNVEPDAAFDRIATAAAQTSQQIRELHDQAKQQAVFWFRASAVAAVLGFVLVSGGIIAVLFFQQNAIAVFSTACGILLEAIARLFFNQSTEANRRVDGYLKNLSEAQATFLAIELSKTGESRETRDRWREVIIKKMLGAERAS
jgi:hypothetical protein